MDYRKDVDWDAFMRKCMNEAPTPDDGRYITPKPETKKDNLGNDSLKKSPKELLIGSIRMTLRREDIMTFVSGLHDLQMNMIETVVSRKEREGFPEATAAIQQIMQKK